MGAEATAVTIFFFILIGAYLLAPLVFSLVHLVIHQFRKHSTVNVRGIKVDEEIAPIVSWAQDCGFTTSCSCQGGAGSAPGACRHTPAYVTFLDADAAHKLFELANRVSTFCTLEKAPNCSHDRKERRRARKLTPEQLTPGYTVAWQPEATSHLVRELRRVYGGDSGWS